MAGNRAVAYMGPGKVEVVEADYPTLELRDGPGVNPANVGRKVPHGAILKCAATNICGSDQRMVRGRTTAPQGLILGHVTVGFDPSGYLHTSHANRGRLIYQLWIRWVRLTHEVR